MPAVAARRLRFRDILRALGVVFGRERAGGCWRAGCYCAGERGNDWWRRHAAAKWEAGLVGLQSTASAVCVGSCGSGCDWTAASVGCWGLGDGAAGLLAIAAFEQILCCCEGSKGGDDRYGEHGGVVVMFRAESPGLDVMQNRIGALLGWLLWAFSYSDVVLPVLILRHVQFLAIRRSREIRDP